MEGGGRGRVENFMTNLLCTRPGYLQRWLKVCALQTPSRAAEGEGGRAVFELLGPGRGRVYSSTLESQPHIEVTQQGRG